MRNRLSLLIVTLLAVTGLCSAQTGAISKTKAKDQVLVDSSRTTWEAYKSRNISAMKAVTAPEYVSFTQAGPSNLQQDIDTIQKLTIESYSLDDPKVTWLTKDVAILRYKCDLKGSFDGKLFKPVYATEVWVNRGGKWQIVSYQETPVS
ncbi:MAG TPA: nuclear transport factor 2 family protein [Bryobacteraceae bacterium]|nr:nuclear transport factor 2 family protein [Bryobacteraceae bacterium]